VPAAAAWETRNELPRYAVALHGSAGLLGAMMEDGVPRDEIEHALRQLLDEIEQQLAEDTAMGGPPQGTA
jgi:SOS response regulatory protein OraA/RecX